MNSLPPPQLRTHATRHLGQRLLVYPELASTNTLALSLATDPANHGLALLAEEQTAGRGQYGRVWVAPPRSSVLMSVLLFPPPKLRRAALMVAWAAVSVCEVVRALTGCAATIKWPNDVLIGGKKVCGILIEQRTTGHRNFPLATVVGLGVNVTQPAEAFAAAGLPDAGSLFSMSGLMLDTGNVASRLIQHLDAEYAGLVNGAWDVLEQRWRDRLGVVGRHVQVETAGRPLQGRLVHLGLDSIALEGADGVPISMEPEAVRHINLA
jgi:BirA family biotin operon repressor/biotin-[acetyl-CoA-carboxylase] ligase